MEAVTGSQVFRQKECFQIREERDTGVRGLPFRSQLRETRGLACVQRHCKLERRLVVVAMALAVTRTARHRRCKTGGGDEGNLSRKR